MKKLVFLTTMIVAGLSQSALAVSTTKIEGYTLYGCESDIYSDVEYKSTKNYCKKDKKDLQAVFKTAKSMKPNFSKDKKLVTYKYKERFGNHITDIFVFDDKNKKIYLQANYASFQDDIKKSPNVVSSIKSNLFCLYETGAWYNESYLEDYMITSPEVYKDDNNKLALVCSEIYTTDEKNPQKGLKFTKPYQLFYYDYKGTDIEAFVNKVSK